jgi:GDP-L-fucose synthase
MKQPLGNIEIMNIFIAGHNGLVGSSLVRLFESKLGVKIHTMDRTKLDLLNRDQVLSYLNDLKPELVIIAAAKVGGIKSNSTFPVDFLTQNIIMQTNLMDASFASNVNNVIFLGSSCIYPKHAEQPIKENSLLTGPLEVTNEAYAIAKIAGVKLIQAYRKQYSRKWISVMPCNLYGVGDNFNAELGHVIPALINKIYRSKTAGETGVKLWGSGNALREFLYVDDLAKAIYKIVETEFFKYDILNVGSGTEITIRDLAKLICKILEFEGEIQWDVSMPDGTPRKVLDSSLISEIGWAPSVSLETGLNEAINYFKTNKLWDLN